MNGMKQWILYFDKLNQQKEGYDFWACDWSTRIESIQPIFLQ